MSAPPYAVTVLTARDGRAVNKRVRRDEKGKPAKSMAPPSGYFTAKIHRLAGLAELADLLRIVGSRVDQVVLPDVLKGAPEGEVRIEPLKVLAERLGVRPTDRQALTGIHDIDGVPTAARIKQNFEPGGFAPFDRDRPDGAPDAMETWTIEEWCEAVDLLFPGFATAGRVIIPSTTSRVLVDGQPLVSSGCHVWVALAEPGDMDRAWREARCRALVTEYKGTRLAFARPKYDRKGGTGRVIAQCLWLPYDPSTYARARIWFEGEPVVQANAGFEVQPPVVELREGPVLDTTKVRKLKPAELNEAQAVVSQAYGVKAIIRAATDIGRGYVITVPDLTMDTILETEDGPRTVGELHAGSEDHVRCQSPHRESYSWAAYYGHHGNGSPFVYDSGTCEKHVLNRTGLESQQELISDWLVETYQFSFVYADSVDDMHACVNGFWRRLSVGDVRSDPIILARMAMASNAPCDAKTGAVKVNSLPSEFKKWLDPAWSAVKATLPIQTEMTDRESMAEIGQLLEHLLMSLASLTYGGERRSLAAWALECTSGIPQGKWTQVGPWQLWARTTVGHGQLQLALKQGLAGQISATTHKKIHEMTETMFTRRCKGVTAPGDNRLHWGDQQVRAVILTTEFAGTLPIRLDPAEPRARALHDHLKLV